MIARWLRPSTAALCCAAATLGSAQNYAVRTTPVNVGVLVIESQRTARGASGQPLNLTPHVWGQLDQDRAIRPAGWNLQNPHAATQMTQAMNARWATLQAFNGSANALPPVGSRLTKRHAGYWEVFLNTVGEDTLDSYNVLALTVSQRMAMNPLEREKLRKFVDQGGILWVDLLDGAAPSDLFNPGPLPFSIGTASGPLFSDRTHPLLSRPFEITPEDLFVLQGGGSTVTVPFAGIRMPGTQGGLAADSLSLGAIAGPSADQRTLAVGRIGDGFMVVSTRGLSQALNRGSVGSIGGGAGQFVNGTITDNRAFLADGPVSDAAAQASAKLIVNMLALGSGYESAGGGSRRSNSTSVDLASPLLQRFSAGGLRPDADGVIVARGRIIAVANNRLIVLDADPSTDLDGNGNPDDGVEDLPGAPYDTLWQSAALTGPVSPPTLTEVPGSSIRDQIMVVDGTGNLLVFPLSPANPASVSPVIIAPPGAAKPAGAEGRYAATVHSGMAFIADATTTQNLGRVWIADLTSLTRLVSSRGWAVDGAQRLPEPSNSPTVGYIPIQDRSGGTDLVVYVPTRADSTQRRPAGLSSLWLASRGESPVQVSVSGGNVTINTRATLQNLPIFDAPSTSGLGVKISLVEMEADPLNPGRVRAGEPFSDALLTAALTGALQVNAGQNGQLIVGFRPGASTPSGQPIDFNVNTGIRVDYFIDWGAPTTGANAAAPESFVRGDLQLPDEAAPSRAIMGRLALSPSGNLFAVAGPTDNGNVPGGSLFAFREEGRGEFRMLYRWELFDTLRINLNDPTGTRAPINYDPALVDYDGVLGFVPFLNQPFQNMRFRSGPTVRGDTVYVAASSGKGGFLAAGGQIMTVLMAFDANPGSPELRLNNLSPNFAIVQPDLARTSLGSRANPDVLSALQPGQFTYELDGPGATKGRLRLDSLMSVKRGRIRDSIAVNLPIIIRQGGQSDIVIEPEAATQDGTLVPGNANGRWSPLRWYSVFNGLTSISQPVLNGTTLYLGGASYLPAIITGNFTFQPSALRGLLYGLDTEISPNDLRAPSTKHAWMKGSLRPWQRYLSSINGTPPALVGSPYFRWPQFKGIQNFNDFQVRLFQAVLPDNQVDGLVAGDGTAVAWGSSALYAFSRADFLVADEGRILRIDAAGNPLWAVENTLAAGSSVPTGVAARTRPIGQPWRVYASGPNAYWVVDPIGDRIVRMDSAGREQRTINEIRLFPGFLPEGLPNNAPLRLRGPRDMTTWTSIEARANNAFNTADNPAAPFELWRHYLIADAGNYRIVELVDRYAYDPNTGQTGAPIEYTDPQSDRPNKRERALGVLLWHIRPELTGKQYAYNSISRVFVPGTGGTRSIFAFGFGNQEAGQASVGLDSGTPSSRRDAPSGFGGIVLYDPSTGADSLITEIGVPEITTGLLWADTAGWATGLPGQPTKKLPGLSSVNLRYLPGGQLSIMIVDSTGVYEAIESGGAWSARWAMPNEAFRVIRRRTSDDTPIGENPLNARPRFARRLDSGEVIMVNGYVGQRRDGQPFYGEVIMVNGAIDPDPANAGFSWNKRNLGFNSLSVKFELPPVEGMRSIASPVFADRR